MFSYLPMNVILSCYKTQPEKRLHRIDKDETLLVIGWNFFLNMKQEFLLVKIDQSVQHGF
jgi:hypothetical protein